jgi:colanic acid/amylovoran biosynthesis glycosyltransferase
MRPVAQHLGIPLVVHFHGYDVSFLLPDAFWEEQYEALFDSASALIGVSNHICDKLKQLGAPEAKIQLLHGGIRLSRFDYDPPKPRFDGKTVRCLHVGRLVEKKAPLDLVRGFSEARQQVGRDSDLRLTIAGDGPMREDVEDLISELGLPDHVRCLGNVPHERVVELMQESHLYTQHCKTASDGDEEGQGITFVEASATGLPIVTTRHNGIPDVVNDGETGFLVSEGDVEAMGEKIAYLALHPAEWPSFSEAGRRRVEEKFDLTKQTRKLISIYQDVV